MKIQLKTGEEIELQISSLILEYIEDYEGGIDRLLKDAEGEKDERGYTRTMYATNHLLYCIIASNYEEELTPKQAIRLVKLEDVEKIILYAKKELEKIKSEEILKESNKKENIRYPKH